MEEVGQVVREIVHAMLLVRPATGISSFMEILSAARGQRIMSFEKG
jgi:hypothetical protein